jgi:hypothetical protein
VGGVDVELGLDPLQLSSSFAVSRTLCCCRDLLFHAITNLSCTSGIGGSFLYIKHYKILLPSHIPPNHPHPNFPPVVGSSALPPAYS